MAKFFMACPSCGSYVEGEIGFFASSKTSKWEYDAKEERVCKVRNVNVTANGLCRYFERKEI